MKKSHIIGAILSLVALVGLNFVPWLTNAYAVDDILRYTQGDTEVFGLDRNGSVRTSSGGFRNDDGLFLQHEIFFDLPKSSQSYFLNPEFKISTGALKGNNTHLVSGATTYVYTGSTDTSLPSIPITQPNFPRTLEIRVADASGSIVIVGTDTFNKKRKETISFSSNTISYGQIPWLGISSFTITITTVEVTQSSATFFVGTSTGIGLSYRFDSSTDIVRITEANVARSTFMAPANLAVNVAENTINISSGSADGGKDWNIWYRSRKTMLAPPTPPPNRP